MKVQAVSNNLRITPRKIGLVAALVRGRSVKDAYVILDHTPKKAAPMLKKVITSAAANARHNHKMDPETLTLDELHIGSGLKMRRYFTAAHGRARPYFKRTSHVRVVVAGAGKATDKAKTSVVKERK